MEGPQSQDQDLPTHLFSHPSLSPIGSTFVVGLPKKLIAKNAKNIGSLSDSTMVGVASLVGLLTLVKAVEEELRNPPDAFLTAKKRRARQAAAPKAKKARPGKKSRKGGDSDDGFVDDEAEEGDESESEASKSGNGAGAQNAETEPEIPVAKDNLFIDRETLCKQYPQYEKEISENFPPLLPRVYAQIEFVPVNGKSRRMHTYENMAGIIYTITLLDSNIKFERILKTVFYNNMNRSNQSRPRSIDNSADKMVSNIKNQIDFMRLFGPLIKSSQTPEYDSFTRATAFEVIASECMFDPDFGNVNAREFLLRESIQNTHFTIPIEELSVTRFVQWTFPWKSILSEREKHLSPGMASREEKLALNVLSSIGIDVKNLNPDDPTSIEMLDRLDPFTKEALDAEKIRASVVKAVIPESIFVDGRTYRRHASDEYKEQLNRFKQMQCEYYEEFFFRNNRDLPASSKSVFSYFDTLEEKNMSLPMLNPVHKSNDPMKASAFFEFVITHQALGEWAGCPESVMNKLVDVFLAAFSVYFLDKVHRMGLHTVFKGPPATGKSWIIDYMQKNFLRGTYMSIGGSSAHIHDYGTGVFRVIEMGEEVQAKQRAVDNDKDSAMLNNLLSGQSSYVSTEEITDINGNKRRRPVARITQTTLARIICANDFGKHNASGTTSATISRYTEIEIGDSKPIEGRMSLTQKAVRHNITSGNQSSKIGAEFYNFIQAMFIFRMVYVSLGVIPDIPTKLTVLIVDYIIQKTGASGLNARDTKTMTLKIKMLHFMFAVYHVCFFLRRNERAVDMFRLEVLEEIAQCSIERVEVIYFVLSQYIYKLTKPIEKAFLKDYAKSKNILVSAKDCGQRGHFNPGLVPADQPLSLAKYQGSIEREIAALSDVTLPFYMLYKTFGEGEKRVETPVYTLAETCDGTSYEVPEDLVDCLVPPRTSFRLSFEVYKNDKNEERIDPNYIFIDSRTIGAMANPNSRSTEKFTVNGNVYTEQEIGEKLKSLQSQFMRAPWIPHLPVKRFGDPKDRSNLEKIGSNQEVVFSLLYNEKITKTNAVFAKLPIVRGRHDGFLVLRIFLESEPGEEVKAILASTFYNRTRPCNSVLNIPSKDAWIAYERFEIRDVPNASFEASSLSIMNNESWKWVTSCFSDAAAGTQDESSVYMETDICEKQALDYYVENWPDANPRELFAKFSDEAVNRKVDEYRTSSNGEEDIVSYPMMFFSEGSRKKKAEKSGGSVKSESKKKAFGDFGNEYAHAVETEVSKRAPKN